MRALYVLYFNTNWKHTSSGDDSYDQFGAIDAPFLAFDFRIRDEQSHVIGSVERNWVGLGRELFTDSGVYLLRLDGSAFTADPNTPESYNDVSQDSMSLDQRAIVLGTAVSIDFDYFSRHSGNG